MCYSAQIKADYHPFQRDWGAVISLERFAELFWGKRKDGQWVKIPKAMREAFRHPRGEKEFALAKLMAEAEREQADRFESELVAQSERLASAQTILAGSKPTRKAADDQRIATNKIAAAQRKLQDLRRREPTDSDSRIFPGQYAAVMIEMDGQRQVVPMRYQCRLPGWNEKTERKYPGTYNARRDKLEASWGQLFGHHHAIMIVTRFYENVWRHEMEGRALTSGEKPENVVLEFDPQPAQEMLVACLWNRSLDDAHGIDLFSFAAITDEPPSEVRAAGHDRCIVPIKAANVDAWLNPDPANLAALYAILDDRERPYYEHRVAA